MTNHRRVPTLSLVDYTSEAHKKQFIQALYESIADYGFVVIKNHGISPEVIQQAYQLSKILFDLPEKTKMNYEGESGQRGYIAFGKETAKGHNIPDLKEYWHIGPEIKPDEECYDDYPNNLWPEELPEFKTFFCQLHDALNNVAKQILAALGAAMDLEPGYFEDMITNGNSVQRLIHYPALGQADTQSAMRAAAHVDINLITLLIGATDSGLELQDRDGSWLPVHNQEGEIVIDTGDMMSRLTNNKLPATMHRVVNPKDTSRARYSIPFFVHPKNNVMLTSQPQFGEAKLPPISAGDFLRERLEENGFNNKSK